MLTNFQVSTPGASMAQQLELELEAILSGPEDDVYGFASSYGYEMATLDINGDKWGILILWLIS